MYQALTRFVVGGLLIALIPLAAEKLGPGVSGVALLFPAVTFAGLLFVGVGNGMPAVASTSLGSAIGLPTVLAFLLAVHYSAKRGLPLALSLTLGLAAWFLVATPIGFAVHRRSSS